MSQPKLTLRPPPHREFIQGYPGIVGAGSRPPAHVAGTVEVRLGTKGLKAAWLRIELRKLETLPGGESWGELIGKGPIDVWTARKDEAYKSETEKGWELLQTADFPFQVTIPEGLPPSAKLEKQAGIAYELVTSLCVRSKKGLLRKETTSSIIQNTHPLWLDKHELHPLWPIYFTPDDQEVTQDDIKVKVLRNSTCFGPGDSVDVRVLISSERVSPIKLKSVSLSIRETITFKGGVKKTFSSNKAASQKSETLSSKSKSFGKKIYKGDNHTFDLACQIPRSHTLMTIQTAKHIEVSYTLRIQVETGKKPILLDHLPITVSNFTRAASEAMIDKIGYVPGLSGPAEADDGVASAVYPSSGSTPTIARSMSFGGSSVGRSGYPGYRGGDLRRRDTVMTQGTAVSGPGMAGRGVPGQIFSWGQYGSAQPFGANQAPRPAFAGPPSIYEGHELAPEESRALFHSTNRPQSAMVLGTGVDPVLVPPSSYHGHSGTVTPIRESSDEGYRHPDAPYEQQDQMRYHQLQQQQQQPIYSTQNVGEIPQRQRSLSNPTSRYPNPHQAQQHQVQQRQPSPSQLQQRHVSSPDTAVMLTSAEAEKERLYERARQQAERNQRRADERRARANGVSISSPASPAANGGRPYSMSNLAPAGGVSSSSTASSTPAAGTGLMSAEQEKARLFERARAEAERYQNSFQRGTSFPPTGETTSSGVDPRRTSVAYWTDTNPGPTATSSKPAQAPVSVQNANSSTIVSGQPAPYPSYMTAEEEKRRLYERAKAEAEAFQRSEVSPAPTDPRLHSSGVQSQLQVLPSSSHQQAASSSNGSTQLPGAWPKNEPTVNLTGAGTSNSASVAGPSGSSSNVVAAAGSSGAISEKEQLRRYYEARDAVARNLGSNTNGADAMYAPEVASAVHHATPHQPADTLPTPTRTTFGDSPFGSASASAPSAMAPQDMRSGTTVQSYLTAAEQQSAREKERLASHYARKQANAEARAAVKSAQPASSADAMMAASGSAPAPIRPAAEYAYAHSRENSGNGIPPRRTSSVIGGRPLGNRSSSTGLPSPPNGNTSSAAGEKAQLAAYYAAKDAVEQNLRDQNHVSSSSNINGMTAGGGNPSVGLIGNGSSIPEMGATSSQNPPNSLFADDTGSIYTNYDPRGQPTSRPPSQSPLPNGASDPWRPRYSSLYDDDDIDDHLANLDGRQVSTASASTIPPPLPPKIPIGGASSGGGPYSGHFIG